MSKQKCILSRKQVLRDMEMWQKDECNIRGEYDTLWQMFRTVVTSSGYGTSEFGGPVWIMDFSLDNLKRLFPDNPWLEAMENEWSCGKYGSGMAKSRVLVRFSRWFELRANYLVNRLGLGNVIVKVESIYGGNLSLYGWGSFLDIMQSLVNGTVERPDQECMIEREFSLYEIELVKKGHFFTRLRSGEMVEKFPCRYHSDFHLFKPSVYGDCYQLHHPCQTKGFVIPEDKPEKFLMLIINDLMDNYDVNGDIPYPQMKFERHLDLQQHRDQHFRPTANIFHWEGKDGRVEEIKFDLPNHYGAWHRGFPPKQNWRVLQED